MARVFAPRPVAPMSYAEARLIVTDASHAVQFDTVTRHLAWQILMAMKQGRRAPVLVLVATETPEPGEAA